MSRLFLRVMLDERGGFGPRKAKLLEKIAQTGSIRSAAAGLKISYRQAWMLLRATEEAFGAPVLERVTGGAHGGGARLNSLGKEILRRYRAIERRAARAASRDILALTRLRGRRLKRH